MQCEERRNSRGAAGASSQAGQDPALYRCRRKGDLQGEKKNPPCLLSRRPCELQRVSSAENPPQDISSKVFFSSVSAGRVLGGTFPFFGGALSHFSLCRSCSDAIFGRPLLLAPVTPRRSSWDPGVVAQIRGQQQHGCFFGGRGRCHPAAGATPVCPLSPLAAGCKLRAPKHCTKVAATRVTMLCIYL